MNIYESLSKIQNELKAPKSQKNKFGNYNYRSAEDILEAVKPLCHRYNTALTVSDTMIMLGDRFYIQATATLNDFSGGKIEVSAFAREANDQKGMAPAQVTGSTSSYARKYALNGLFNIDDTKDDDFNNKHEKAKKQATPAPDKYDSTPKTLAHARITEYQKAQIVKLVMADKIDLSKLLAYYKVLSTDELNGQQANTVIAQGNMKKGREVV